jgi:hypothetical protein
MRQNFWQLPLPELERQLGADARGLTRRRQPRASTATGLMFTPRAPVIRPPFRLTGRQ